MNQDVQKNWWVSDQWSRWLLVIALVLNIATVVIIWKLMPRNFDVSPLHYTIYFGINLTGHWSHLFLLPAIGATAIISHLIIIRTVSHLIWRRLWLILALIINIMMAIDVVALLMFIRSTSF